MGVFHFIFHIYIYIYNFTLWWFWENPQGSSKCFSLQAVKYFSFKIKLLSFLIQHVAMGRHAVGVKKRGSVQFSKPHGAPSQNIRYIQQWLTTRTAAEWQFEQYFWSPPHCLHVKRWLWNFGGKWQIVPHLPVGVTARIAKRVSIVFRNRWHDPFVTDFEHHILYFMRKE